MRSPHPKTTAIGASNSWRAKEWRDPESPYGIVPLNVDQKRPKNEILQEFDGRCFPNTEHDGILDSADGRDAVDAGRITIEEQPELDLAVRRAGAGRRRVASDGGVHPHGGHPAAAGPRPADGVPLRLRELGPDGHASVGAAR